jgi:hypothetical protein
VAVRAGGHFEQLADGGEVLALEAGGDEVRDIRRRLGVNQTADGFGDGGEESDHGHHADCENPDSRDDFNEAEGAGRAARGAPSARLRGTGERRADGISGWPDASHTQNPLASLT